LRIFSDVGKKRHTLRRQNGCALQRRFAPRFDHDQKPAAGTTGDFNRTFIALSV
jgi:hypothetical protein